MMVVVLLVLMLATAGTSKVIALTTTATDTAIYIGWFSVESGNRARRRGVTDATIVVASVS